LFVFAEKWSHWGPEDCAKPPPAEAAQLTLQVLYKLVQTFSKQQVSIKEKTPVRMASSQRQAASQEAASLEQAAEATRALIGTLVALDMLLCSRPAHGSQPMSTAYNKQKQHRRLQWSSNSFLDSLLAILSIPSSGHQARTGIRQLTCHP